MHFSQRTSIYEATTLSPLLRATPSYDNDAGDATALDLHRRWARSLTTTPIPFAVPAAARLGPKWSKVRRFSHHPFRSASLTSLTASRIVDLNPASLRHGQASGTTNQDNEKRQGSE